MTCTIAAPVEAEAIARRNALAEHYLGLVGAIAGKFRGGAVDYADLVGVGQVALLEACRTADEEERTEHELKGYLSRAIGWDVRDELKRGHLRHERGNLLPGIVPDHRAGLGEERERAERERAARALVGRLLGVLYPRERLLVRLIYRLDDGPPVTQAEAAERLGVTRQRVRMILRAAMRRMARAAGKEERENHE